MFFSPDGKKKSSNLESGFPSRKKNDQQKVLLWVRKTLSKRGNHFTTLWFGDLRFAADRDTKARTIASKKKM
jgi:hypothetical protein